VLPTGRIEEMLSLRRRPFSRFTEASMIWQLPRKFASVQTSHWPERILIEDTLSLNR